MVKLRSRKFRIIVKEKIKELEEKIRERVPEVPPTVRPPTRPVTGTARFRLFYFPTKVRTGQKVPISFVVEWSGVGITGKNDAIGFGITWLSGPEKGEAVISPYETPINEYQTGYSYAVPITSPSGVRIFNESVVFNRPGEYRFRISVFLMVGGYPKTFDAKEVSVHVGDVSEPIINVRFAMPYSFPIKSAVDGWFTVTNMGDENTNMAGIGLTLLSGEGNVRITYKGKTYTLPKLPSILRLPGEPLSAGGSYSDTFSITVTAPGGYAIGVVPYYVRNSSVIYESIVKVSFSPYEPKYPRARIYITRFPFYSNKKDVEVRARVVNLGASGVVGFRVEGPKGMLVDHTVPEGIRITARVNSGGSADLSCTLTFPADGKYKIKFIPGHYEAGRWVDDEDVIEREIVIRTEPRTEEARINLIASPAMVIKRWNTLRVNILVVLGPGGDIGVRFINTGNRPFKLRIAGYEEELKPSESWGYKITFRAKEYMNKHEIYLPEKGEYKIRAELYRVEDEKVLSSDEETIRGIEAERLEERIQCRLAASPPEGKAPLTVNFMLTWGGGSGKYNVELRTGDGNKYTKLNTTDKEWSVAHTYTKPRTYYPILIVRDVENAVNFDTSRGIINVLPTSREIERTLPTPKLPAPLPERKIKEIAPGVQEVVEESPPSVPEPTPPAESVSEGPVRVPKLGEGVKKLLKERLDLIEARAELLGLKRVVEIVERIKSRLEE